MKLPLVIFVLLLGMCVTLAVCLMTPEPSAVIPTGDGGEMAVALGRGYQHPGHVAMQKGDPGPVRYQPIRWASWSFAILLISLFVCLIALGGRKAGRLGPLKIPLVVGFVVYLAAMIWMLVAYEQYLTGDSPVLWGAFPIPSAVMLYAVWPAPMVFVVTYVLMFDRWFYSPEDAAKFQALIQQRDANRQDEP